MMWRLLKKLFYGEPLNGDGQDFLIHKDEPKTDYPKPRGGGINWQVGKSVQFTEDVDEWGNVYFHR